MVNPLKNNGIMKKHIFAIMLLALASGCREADTDLAFAGQEAVVRFAAPGAVVSRAIVEADGTQLNITWNSDDAIGIFGRGAVSGNNYPYLATPTARSLRDARSHRCRWTGFMNGSPAGRSSMPAIPMTKRSMVNRMPCSFRFQRTRYKPQPVRRSIWQLFVR